MREEMANNMAEVQPIVWVETALNSILLCCAAAYIIYGCIFLVNDRAKCGGYNRFWVYCCATLFSSFFGYFISLGIYTKDEKAADGSGKMNYWVLAMYILFELPFLIWGSFALFILDNICFNEKESEDVHHRSQLYIWAIVAYSFRCLYLLLNIIGSIIASNRSPIKKEFDESC